MGVTGFEAFQILLGFRVSFLSLWSSEEREGGAGPEDEGGSVRYQVRVSVSAGKVRFALGLQDLGVQVTGS